MTITVMLFLKGYNLCDIKRMASISVSVNTRVSNEITGLIL